MPYQTMTLCTMRKLPKYLHYFLARMLCNREHLAAMPFWVLLKQLPFKLPRESVRYSSFLYCLVVLSILYPKPNQFRFYNDSLYFILIMFVAAMIGFFISLRQLIILQVHPREIIIRALDVITICVPPALPIAMTFGIAFAIRRMKQSKIYCISPPRVNISGKVKVVCFDKTGTLTEDSLDMHLANPCQNATFDEPVKEREIASKMKNVHPMLLACMASCHSLAMINQELVGDPLEVKMFHSTKSVCSNMV